METDSKVRFISKGKDGAWAKGDFGILRNILALRPQATSDIYLVELEDHQIVWATHEDVEAVGWEQLSLF